MKSEGSVRAQLAKSKLVFWDFDGVIKDSLSVKTEAFEKLFLPYGQKIVQRVKQHHEANGGVSRFKKMPLYLFWACGEVTDEQVKKFCNAFSELVVQAVIDSPWVPGVLDYLANNHQTKYFVIVTATPQDEIDKILTALEIDDFFGEVFGAPAEKKDVIKSVLEEQKITPNQALMIGDTETDLLAAQTNLVPFLVRKTSLNLHLQRLYSGPQFTDLSCE